MSTAWPRRVEARRGIRRVLRAAGRRRRAAPADGRRRVDGGRRGGGRARHPGRADGRPRPAGDGRLAGGRRLPDPRELRRGRPARAPLVPRPAAAAARRAGRAPRALPPPGRRAQHRAPRRHRRVGRTPSACSSSARASTSWASSAWRRRCAGTRPGVRPRPPRSTSSTPCSRRCPPTAGRCRSRCRVGRLPPVKGMATLVGAWLARPVAAPALQPAGHRRRPRRPEPRGGRELLPHPRPRGHRRRRPAPGCSSPATAPTPPPPRGSPRPARAGPGSAAAVASTCAPASRRSSASPSSRR